MAAVSHEPSVSVRIVRPAPRWAGFGVRELWLYRELLFFLAWRDLKVRYKQTVFGVVWAVLQPIMYTVVFTLFFGRIAHVPHGTLPYSLLTLSGSTLWLFFANSVNLASGSLVGGGSLITKVYFPRLLAALAPIMASVVDFVLSFLVLLGVAALYGYYPQIERIWAVIPFSGVALLTAVGVGAWLAALNVKYRDVRYVVPFMMQLWMFASPVVYIPQNLHGAWLTAYYLNPMAGAVEGFRWAVVGGTLIWQVALSAVVALVVVVVGVAYFRRKEREFADVV
jgi:lipopolysaccharide transport system permease protein